jgi:hypothetical protein
MNRAFLSSLARQNLFLWVFSIYSSFETNTERFLARVDCKDVGPLQNLLTRVCKSHL